MEFTLVRHDGKTEKRRQIPYTIKQTGPSVWTAYRVNGSILARNYVSERSLRASCDTCTEPA